MSYKIQGRVIHIADTKFSASGFASREFVIETADKYPQKVKLQVIKDDCDMLDNIMLNATVEAFFNVRGASYPESKNVIKDNEIVREPTGETSYFTSLQAWKIEVTGHDSAYEPAPTKSNDYAKPEHKVAAKVEEDAAPEPIQAADDDLPI
jgi:hypothetical protein